jgi:hypothetical protein
MDVIRTLIRHRRCAAVACALAAALTIVPASAQQDGAADAGQLGFFATIGRWLDRQAKNFNTSFKNAGKGFDEFGHEAGIAARETANNARDAAHAVTHLPKTLVVTGHANCTIAANGAPDCLSAADEVCKAKGFRSGKSLDMTTAEICPPKVYLAGRNSGPGCHTETFVSRALCQ